MKKKHLIALITVLAMAGLTATAQTKIGDNKATINPGSVLELESTNKGLLPPRVTLTDRMVWGLNGNMPVKGMIVFNTTVGTNGLDTGLVVWEGKWNRLTNQSSAGDFWALQGNAGTTKGTNFIGTTDDKDLVFKTNGKYRAHLDSLGGMWLGDSSLVYNGSFGNTYSGLFTSFYNKDAGTLTGPAGGASNRMAVKLGSTNPYLIGTLYGSHSYLNVSVDDGVTRGSGDASGAKIMAMRGGFNGDADGTGHLEYLSASYLNSGLYGNAKGTTNNVYGTLVEPVNQSATGVINNYYGYFMAPQNGTGTITNKYGVYIDNTFKNYFGGKVNIGALDATGISKLLVHADANEFGIGIVDTLKTNNHNAGGIGSKFKWSDGESGQWAIVGANGGPAPAISDAVRFQVYQGTTDSWYLPFIAKRNRDLQFGGDQSNIDATVRMTIKANGDVGIGTTAPRFSKLNVYDNHVGTADGRHSFASHLKLSGGGTGKGFSAIQGITALGAESANYTPEVHGATGYVMVGLELDITAAHNHTPKAFNGTMSDVRGLAGAVYNFSTGTGVLDIAAGVTADMKNLGTGIVRNAFGIRVDAAEATGSDAGNPHNAYGVFISDRVTASGGSVNNAWALYSNSPQPSYVAGRVGIGTTIPSQALEVAGNVKANSFISATTTYPDYVFEKYKTGKSLINSNYQFSTLKQTEDFINKNGHLPGVTSYKEVEKAGMNINVAQTAVQTLEKVEELYLHTIELSKTVEAQQKLIMQLEKRIAELENKK